MPTTLATQRGINPATSSAPMHTAGASLHLSARTVAWLAEHHHARQVVRLVWETLVELERAGSTPVASRRCGGS